ncbi:hypothetical protein [Undibacterium danionis]|uniref:Uncharacterized protein n=1 Tax=Undibacterium danionis TaxID=1812100 RepID=A0ABV6IAW7_9BURK
MMKTFLKLGAVLVVFGLMLSALGAGIMRSHAVVPDSKVSTSANTAPSAKPATPSAKSGTVELGAMPSAASSVSASSTSSASSASTANRPANVPAPDAR